MNLVPAPLIRLSVLLFAFVSMVSAQSIVLSDFNSPLVTWENHGLTVSIAQGAGQFSGTASNEAYVELVPSSPLAVGTSRSLTLVARTLAANRASAFGITLLSERADSSGTATGIVSTAQLGGSDLATVTVTLEERGTFESQAVTGIRVHGISPSDGILAVSVDTIYMGSAAASPIFVVQPTPQSVPSGLAASFDAVVQGTAPLTHRWFKDGVALVPSSRVSYSSVNALLSIQNVQPGDAGEYSLEASNAAGTRMSAPARLTVTAALVVPALSSQPSGRTLAIGSRLVLSSTVSGSPPFTYQWHKDGVAIPGAISDTLTIEAVKMTDGGRYTVVATNRAGSTTSAEALVVVSEIDRNEDLSVAWIQRFPILPFVQGSNNATRDGWPAVGSDVTWRAVVKSWYPVVRSRVAYRWSIDGATVATGAVDLAPGAWTTVNLVRPWTFTREQLSFEIDADNAIVESSERNNVLSTWTDAISVGFWVEQSIYDYFHQHQHKLGDGANGWEDWAQRQVAQWNTMFSSAVDSFDAPNGVLDRIRLDKIVIVPDGALPLSGGLASNTPDMNDRTVDLMWGFTSELLKYNYSNHTSRADDNAFFFEGSLIHELGHARYLIDTYGFNVIDRASDPRVLVRHAGQPIAGTPYLPRSYPWWDHVLINSYSTSYLFDGLMGSGYDRVDRYSAAALNLIAGRRATQGNYNAPGNIGAFINDLPSENQIQLFDGQGKPLSGALVRIYQATGAADSYGKQFDETPDLTLNADQNGRVNVGRNPFSSSPLVHTYGISSMVALLKAEAGNRVGYGFIHAGHFNMSYWRGNTALGRYSLTIPMIGSTREIASMASWPEGSGWRAQIIAGGDQQPQSVTVAGVAAAFEQGSWWVHVPNGGSERPLVALWPGGTSVQTSIGFPQNVTAPRFDLVTAAPLISSNPISLSVTAGQPASLRVTASGDGPLRYQWRKNGVAIAGATGSTLSLSLAAEADGGVYTVAVSNLMGTVVSSAATLAVAPALESRITNVSIRTTLAARQLLIVGLTMSGGEKPVLVRAVGPGLGAFGVTGFMGDPTLALFDGGQAIAQNDDWSGASELSSTFAALGAFPLVSTSKDAALLRSFSGGKTVQVGGENPGNVLVEAYDAGSGNSPRLSNVSARNRAGSGDDIMIAGFTIAGNTNKTVLIRAIGPTLAGFGLSSVLADPKVEIYSGGTKVAENDDWQTALALTFARVGAFPLLNGSKDAALELSLPPGGYTVHVSSASGGAGEALIEIYEVPALQER